MSNQNTTGLTENELTNLPDPVPEVISSEDIAAGEPQFTGTSVEASADTPVQETSNPVTESKQEGNVDTPKGNLAQQTYPLNLPSTKDTEKVSLPTDYPSAVKDILNELPNINLSDTEEARRWINSLNEGLEQIHMQEMFKDTFSDPSKHFTQKPEHAGKPLVAASPKFEKLENSVIKGEKAVIRVLQSLGLGTLFQVPLWHTGIWVTIKPPTEAEIIELNRQLISDKIQFGRYTYGLAFANTTSYTTERLISFVLDHIYNTSLKVDSLTASDLTKLISCQDIPILLWGIVSTMYPNGFNYERPCISDPEKCNHVLQETINITKLLWTTIDTLTDYQREHMSYRQARSRTMDQVTRYKDDLAAIHKTRVKLLDTQEIYMTIKSPSISEYIDAGHVWIDSIVTAVERTINSSVTDGEKENLITKYAQASRLRQYAHWVESIELDTNISEDQETVNELLNVLSADEEIFASIMTKIKDYINRSVISLVGIPGYDCPKCGEAQSTESLPKFVNVIPLDVQQLFFVLFTQRLIKLTDR